MLQRNRTTRSDVDDDAIVCPIREILGRIGGRWTLDIIMLLDARAYHFADLDRSITKISRRMLTLTLRALERDGLIFRRQKPPSMVFYELTDLGTELARHLHALTEWSRARRNEIYASRQAFDGGATDVSAT